MKTLLFGGLHLTGPNVGRSALAVVAFDAASESCRLIGLHSRLSNYGQHLSDERITEIILSTPQLEAIYVDAPLDLPPCMLCKLQTCPGVHSCDDPAVSFMQAISARLNPRKQRRQRPIQPQAHRLWDLLALEKLEELRELREYHFSPQHIPLAVRARTLQRRLEHKGVATPIRETSLPIGLHLMAESMGLRTDVVKRFRSFEEGLATRQMLLQALLDCHWLDIQNDQWIDQLDQDLDAFKAVLTAVFASIVERGLTLDRPSQFPSHQSWVHLPLLSCKLALDLPPEDGTF
jgi:hypothetical protein